MSAFQLNNPGRPAGARSLNTIQRDARRSAIRILGAHAPELIELGVQRALAGNPEALSGCLALLASIAGDNTKQGPSKSSAPVSDRQND